MFNLACEYEYDFHARIREYVKKLTWQHGPSKHVIIEHSQSQINVICQICAHNNKDCMQN